MPYHHPVIFSVNRKLTKRGPQVQPGPSCAARHRGEQDTCRGRSEADLAKEIDDGSLDHDHINGLLQFAESMPATIDVAMRGGGQAGARGRLLGPVTWQEGVAWELRTWALKPDAGAERGVFNLFLISPNPEQ